MGALVTMGETTPLREVVPQGGSTVVKKKEEKRKKRKEKKNVKFPSNSCITWTSKQRREKEAKSSEYLLQVFKYAAMFQIDRIPINTNHLAILKKKMRFHHGKISSL